MTAALLGFLVFEFAGCGAVLAHACRREEPEGASELGRIALGLVVAGLGFLIWSKGG